MASEIIRIFPKASELNQILNRIECPEEDCCEVFKNTPNLSLHLLKTHGKDGSLKSSVYGCKVAEYYCPEIGCKYCFNPDFTDETTSKFSNRYFTQFKYLKQHYIKVHVDKTFKCEKCNKGFPTDSHKSRHQDICGSKFICSCGVVYSSLESLQTHARREKHSYNRVHTKGHNNRTRKSEASRNSNVVNTQENKNISNASCSVLNLPSDINILILHGIVALDNNVSTENNFSGSTTVSTQTDVMTKRRKTLSPSKYCANEKFAKKRTSKQTQTGEKRPKKTTETQTVQLNMVSGDTRRSVLKNNSGFNVRKRKKSMETQTINCSSATTTVINTEISSFNNDNNISNDGSYYSSSCTLAVGTENSKTNNEDSNSSDNISQKDICLPQLWLNTENDNDCKMNKEDSDQNYSTGLDNITENNKGNILSAMCLDDNIDLEQHLDFANNLSLFNKQQDFIKDSNKESNSSCHIETQTDHDSSISNLLDDYLTDFDHNILDQYTQTCDDIMLPDDIVLDLTNNETQTAWSFCDDILDVVNSETQTNCISTLTDYSV